MATITDVDWNGAMTSIVPDIDDARRDEVTGLMPWFRTVEAQPRIGMEVDLWYVRSDKTYVEASLPKTEFPPTWGRSELFGHGTITAVRYAPGRSGKLYPYLTVDTDDGTTTARALGSMRSARKAAAARENAKLGGRPKGTKVSDETRARMQAAQVARRERETIA